MAVRALIKTFGCKTNFADSIEIERALIKLGIIACLAEEGKDHLGEQAYDIFVVNSCVVTNEAEGKTRRFIRRLLRKFPNSEIILTGCGARARRIAEGFAKFPIRLVGEIGKVAQVVAEIVDGGQLPHHPSETEAIQRHKALIIDSSYPRSRYFLKVQDGCNFGCSFCIIPQSRTLSCKSLEQILKEVTLAQELGAPEIVLTGINIGLYREPHLGLSFYEMLSRLLEKISRDCRLRLSSIEPEHVNESLIELFGHPRMCPHLHMPLQSGSDRLLGHMRRNYSAKDYLRIVEKFRCAFPWGAVTADIMVGYPLEEASDFEKTLQVVKACKFERVHIFPYSKRPGTLASFLEPLEPKTVKEREQALFQLTNEIAEKSLSRFIGRRAEVAVEERHLRREELRPEKPSEKYDAAKQNDAVLYTGYGEAYQRVHFETKNDLPKALSSVKLVKLEGREFTAELI